MLTPDAWLSVCWRPHLDSLFFKTKKKKHLIIKKKKRKWYFLKLSTQMTQKSVLLPAMSMIFNKKRDHCSVTVSLTSIIVNLVGARTLLVVRFYKKKEFWTVLCAEQNPPKSFLQLLKALKRRESEQFIQHVFVGCGLTYTWTPFIKCFCSAAQ